MIFKNYIKVLVIPFLVVFQTSFPIYLKSNQRVLGPSRHFVTWVLEPLEILGHLKGT